MVDVIHGVGKPRDARTEPALSFSDVHQALIEIIWTDVVIEFRVRERLINIVKLDAFGCVIDFDRLQTGDVT